MCRTLTVVKLSIAPKLLETKNAQPVTLKPKEEEELSSCWKATATKIVKNVPLPVIQTVLNVNLILIKLIFNVKLARLIEMLLLGTRPALLRTITKLTLTPVLPAPMPVQVVLVVPNVPDVSRDTEPLIQMPPIKPVNNAQLETAKNVMLTKLNAKLASQDSERELTLTIKNTVKLVNLDVWLVNLTEEPVLNVIPITI